ncbi:unnamed protein product [Onchocerca flexuosa]|uniref:Transcriptional regulator n=1 Tax=Onchocerca flexuosa TaxID=387005 RepID=A0A183HXP3_9BILA|nr:unnamed protein product [Onchocerca flexuosa]
MIVMNATDSLWLNGWIRDGERFIHVLITCCACNL